MSNKFKIKGLPASWLNQATAVTDLMFQLYFPN